MSPKPHTLSSTLTEDSATSQAISLETPSSALHPSEEPEPSSENSHQEIPTPVEKDALDTGIQIAPPAAGPHKPATTSTIATVPAGSVSIEDISSETVSSDTPAASISAPSLGIKGSAGDGNIEGVQEAAA
jgi:hypothetical protein